MDAKFIIAFICLCIVSGGLSENSTDGGKANFFPTVPQAILSTSATGHINHSILSNPSVQVASSIQKRSAASSEPILEFSETPDPHQNINRTLKTHFIIRTQESSFDTEPRDSDISDKESSRRTQNKRSSYPPHYISKLFNMCPNQAASCPACNQKSYQLPHDFCHSNFVILKVVLISPPLVDANNRVCGKFGKLALQGHANEKEFRSLIRFSVSENCGCFLKASKQYYLVTRLSEFVKDRHLFHKIALSAQSILVPADIYTEQDVNHALNECSNPAYRPPEVTTPYARSYQPPEMTTPYVHLPDFYQPAVDQPPPRFSSTLPPEMGVIYVEYSKNPPLPPAPLVEYKAHDYNNANMHTSNAEHSFDPRLDDHLVPANYNSDFNEAQPRNPSVSHSVYVKESQQPDSNYQEYSSSLKPPHPINSELTYIPPSPPEQTHYSEHSPNPPTYQQNSPPPAQSNYHEFTPSPPPEALSMNTELYEVTHTGSPAPGHYKPHPSYLEDPLQPPTMRQPTSEVHAPSNTTSITLQKIEPLEASQVYYPSSEVSFRAKDLHIRPSQYHLTPDQNPYMPRHDFRNPETGSHMRKIYTDPAANTYYPSSNQERTGMSLTSTSCSSPHGAGCPGCYKVKEVGDITQNYCASTYANVALIKLLHQKSYGDGSAGGCHNVKSIVVHDLKRSKSSSVYHQLTLQIPNNCNCFADERGQVPVLFLSYDADPVTSPVILLSERYRLFLLPAPSEITLPDCAPHPQNRYAVRLPPLQPLYTQDCPYEVQQSCPHCASGLPIDFCHARFAVIGVLELPGPYVLSYRSPSMSVKTTKLPSHYSKSVVIEISQPAAKTCIHGSIRVIRHLVSPSYQHQYNIPFTALPDCPCVHQKILLGFRQQFLIVSSRQPLQSATGALLLTGDYVFLPGNTPLPQCGQPPPQYYPSSTTMQTREIENSRYSTQPTPLQKPHIPVPPHLQVYSPVDVPNYFVPKSEHDTAPTYTEMHHGHQPHDPTVHRNIPSHSGYSHFDSPNLTYIPPYAPSYSKDTHATPVSYDPAAYSELFESTLAPQEQYNPFQTTATPSSVQYKATPIHSWISQEYSSEIENPPTTMIPYDSHQSFKSVGSYPFVAECGMPKTSSCPSCAEISLGEFKDVFCRSKFAVIVAIGLNYSALDTPSENPEILIFNAEKPQHVKLEDETEAYSKRQAPLLTISVTRARTVDSMNYRDLDYFCYYSKVRGLYDVYRDFTHNENIRDLEVVAPVSCDCTTWGTGPAYGILLFHADSEDQQGSITLSENHSYYRLPEGDTVLPSCSAVPSHSTSEHSSVRHPLVTFDVPAIHNLEMQPQCGACTECGVIKDEFFDIPCEFQFAAVVEVLETSAGSHAAPSLEISESTGYNPRIITFSVRRNDFSSSSDGYGGQTGGCKFATLKVLRDLSVNPTMDGQTLTVLGDTHCNCHLFKLGTGVALLLSKNAIYSNQLLMDRNMKTVTILPGTSRIQQCSSYSESEIPQQHIAISTEPTYYISEPPPETHTVPANIVYEESSIYTETPHIPTPSPIYQTSDVPGYWSTVEYVEYTDREPTVLGPPTCPYTCPKCQEVSTLTAEVYCNSGLTLLMKTVGLHYVNPTCSNGTVISIYDVTPNKQPTLAVMKVNYEIDRNCECPNLNDELFVLLVKNHPIPLTNPLSLSLSNQDNLYWSNPTKINLPACPSSYTVQARSKDLEGSVVIDGAQKPLRKLLKGFKSLCPAIDHTCPKCATARDVDELQDLVCSFQEVLRVSRSEAGVEGSRTGANGKLSVTQKVSGNNYSVDINISEYPCNLPPEEGSCGRSTTRYYFDAENEYCSRFQYSGCNGNANNFPSAKECEDSCLVEDFCERGNLTIHDIEKSYDESIYLTKDFQYAIPEHCECPTLMKDGVDMYIASNLEEEIEEWPVQLSKDFLVVSLPKELKGVQLSC